MDALMHPVQRWGPETCQLACYPFRLGSWAPLGQVNSQAICLLLPVRFVVNFELALVIRKMSYTQSTLVEVYL